jgi:hypothetical protein
MFYNLDNDKLQHIPAVMYLEVCNNYDQDGLEYFIGDLGYPAPHCPYPSNHEFSVRRYINGGIQSHFESEKDVVDRAIEMLPANVMLLFDGCLKSDTDVLYPCKLHYAKDILEYEMLSSIYKSFCDAKTEREKRFCLMMWIQQTVRYVSVQGD